MAFTVGLKATSNVPDSETFEMALCVLAPQLDVKDAANLSATCRWIRAAMFSFFERVELRLTWGKTVEHLRLLSRFLSLQEVVVKGCSKYSNTLLKVVEVHAIGSLCCLTRIHVHNCNLETLLPFTQLCRLLTLSLVNCSISSSHASCQHHQDPLAPLSRLTTLQHLTLRACFPVTDSTLQLLSTLPALHSLDLSKCQGISSAGLAHLSHLATLRQLSLEGCRALGTSFVEPIARLTGLERMNIKGVGGHLWDLTHQQLVPHGWLQLSSLRALRQLDLEGCWGAQAAAPALLLLPSLQHLSLGKVDKGALASLTGMQGLQSLELHSCNESDLHVVSGLPSLRVLDSRSIPFLEANLASRLRGVTHLSLNGVYLADDALKAICTTATGLQKLVLEFYQIHSGLDHLSLLKSLDVLAVRVCDGVVGSSPRFRCLPSLSSLDFESSDGDAIKDVALDLSGATMLTHLGWTCRSIHSADLQQAAALHSLSLKSVTACDEDLFPHIAGIRGLRAIKLRDCGGLQGSGLAHLSRLSHLSSLQLLQCDGLTDAGLSHLTLLTSLKRLGLEVWQPLCLPFLSALTSLQDLGVNNVTLGKTDVDLRGVCLSLPRLEKLRLRYFQLTSPALCQLSELKQLRHLQLFHSDRMDAGSFAVLAQLTGLEKLRLVDCCRSCVEGLVRLAPLPMLRQLRLQRCTFTLDGQDVGLGALKGLPPFVEVL